MCIWCEVCICVQAHVDDIKKTHLRELMGDTERCKSMMMYDTLLDLLKLFVLFLPLLSILCLCNKHCIVMRNTMLMSSIVNSMGCYWITRVSVLLLKQSISYSNWRRYAGQLFFPGYGHSCILIALTCIPCRQHVSKKRLTRCLMGSG